MEFRVLGDLEIRQNGKTYVPSAVKPRQVLGLLQIRANRMVHVDTIIEELWADNPPRSAMTTTQTYVYHLRKALRSELGVACPEDLIATTTPGYTLRIDKGHLDSHVFEKLASEGRELFQVGCFAEAADRFREALVMWRGMTLANVPLGRVLQGYVTQMEEMKVTVLEMRISADMELGRHRFLIPELVSLVAAHPFNEWMHAQLIRALGRSGRRGEALKAYQSARQVLDQELGLEPSDELREVQHEVLTSSRSPRLRGAVAMGE